MKLNKIQPSCKIIEHNQFKICLLSNITQSICLSVFFWSSQEGDWLARSVSKARFRILTPTRLALRDYKTFSLAILTDVFHCQFSFWHLHSGHDCSSGLSWQSWQKMCPSGHWNTCKGPFFYNIQSTLLLGMLSTKKENKVHLHPWCWNLKADWTLWQGECLPSVWSSVLFLAIHLQTTHLS